MYPDATNMWLTHDEKLELRNERKKEYNRDRFRQKRSLFLTETQALNEQLVKFTAELDTLKKTSALPWKDVAGALEDVRKMSEFQNRDLRKKVHQYKELCLTMSAWINNGTASIRAFPSTSSPMWQMSSLPQTGPSRKVGLEWISKRLYHNVGSEIEKSRVPVTDKPYFAVNVEPMGESYCLTEYKQRIESATFDHVVKCLDKIYLTIMAGDEVEVNDPSMLYIIYESDFGRSLGIKTTEKMLVSRFCDAEQYVIFTHGVTGDEKYEDPVRCNYWSAWVVVKRLTPTEILIKHGYKAHGLRYADRFLTLEEEMPQLSVYDDDESKFNALSQNLKQYRQKRYIDDLATFARFSKEISDSGDS
ncbi:Aste57867_20650 [Aphanomyces stellatus]|uniref:Aste57867_20650 protein n=1 Tax=Aphanomyces stellatus TaxID=120398 RepID=A0A485LK56_9STRA|nr:hypothetical protein As57867_020582 [Aphanomyces stellatus]VFT97330.1 Aste57867_20650 [Aphanomyces stellatus]